MSLFKIIKQLFCFHEWSLFYHYKECSKCGLVKFFEDEEEF